MAAVLKVFLALALLSPLALPANAERLETFELQLAQAKPGEAPTDIKLEEEATIRHSQLQWHQAFGLATLGSMALTAGIGAYTTNFSGPNQYGTVRNLHMALGGLTTGLYLGAATLALTTPKGYDVAEPGTDAVDWHRKLAWLHAAGLGTTVVMGLLTSIGKLDAKTHGILGGTTLGLMALSAGVIAFEF